MNKIICLILIPVVSSFMFVCLANHKGKITSITCSTVDDDARPCLPFATGKSNSIDQDCCSGLHNLIASTSTIDDKKIACNCLATAFKIFPVQDNLLKKIPDLCKLQVPFNMSTTVNCGE
ncbi:Non-specific lipid-transfer protein C, cotyledon-specific isoform [Linum grandiflorum]